MPASIHDKYSAVIDIAILRWARLNSMSYAEAKSAHEAAADLDRIAKHIDWVEDYKDGFPK